VKDPGPKAVKSTNEKRKWKAWSNLLYRVSKNPRISLPLSRTAALLEVFGPSQKPK
jgi:hypothetical protein